MRQIRGRHTCNAILPGLYLLRPVPSRSNILQSISCHCRRLARPKFIRCFQLCFLFMKCKIRAICLILATQSMSYLLLEPPPCLDAAPTAHSLGTRISILTPL
ncbi:hypothetical protein BDV98DRAFT_423379 [Pterulicium gracile]|uniref:Uncharacterized protein n=1 Tax=Pterulicium gracile TaxID=1884261 RepID=A0A5C3QLB3_9AGAR|nr:hypothetical protein BDV98DRAFT_423379 [Pterula gracilis]